MTGFRSTLDNDSSEPGPVLGMRLPNVARFYDAILAGKDNFAPDRDLAAQAAAAAPALPTVLRHNRAFAARAVRWMTRQGIAQFLDLGCGLPTSNNTHQIAQRHNPHARVVYVDHDPVVLSHGRAILADNRRTAVVGADLRDPGAVLHDEDTRLHLDLSRPVGVLLTATLHHIPDGDDPHDIVREYMASLPLGSMLALSHFHAPERFEPLADQARRAEEVLLAGLGSGWFRPRPTLAAFFDGLELDRHGLCALPNWRPDHAPSHSPESPLALCGVARAIDHGYR